MNSNGRLDRTHSYVFVWDKELALIYIYITKQRVFEYVGELAVLFYTLALLFVFINYSIYIIDLKPYQNMIQERETVPNFSQGLVV